MKEPVTHIEQPSLPWRDDEHLTECRLDATKYPTVSRDEAIRQFRDLGRTRFVMITCITCFTTMERYGRSTWEDDPVALMNRHTNIFRQSDKSSDRLRAELRAIGMLIEAHRDEFATTVADLSATSSLDAHRQAKRAQRRYPR